MMGSLPDQQLQSVLEPLVKGIQQVLGPGFFGAYLGGSFAHGGWDAFSDVDFNVVVARDLHPSELEPLRVVHARVFAMDVYYARHLEGSYFSKEVLGDLSRAGEPIWYLDNGSLNFERSSHDNTLVNRWVLRECGVVLAGPDPQAWIPPVPAAQLKNEIRRAMVDWGEEILTGAYQIENLWAQAFAVLSYCRMLQSLETGQVGSKAAGAAWAKETLDPRWRSLIDHALSARLNQYAQVFQPADEERVQATLAFIRRALLIAGRDEQAAG